MSVTLPPMFAGPIERQRKADIAAESSGAESWAAETFASDKAAPAASEWTRRLCMDGMWGWR